MLKVQFIMTVFKKGEFNECNDFLAIACRTTLRTVVLVKELKGCTNINYTKKYFMERKLHTCFRHALEELGNVTWKSQWTHSF